jgi:hypothetical protein
MGHHRALDLLRRVVDTAPKFRYTPRDGGGCSYAHEDVPGCLIGHVLFRSGWTVEELQILDAEENATAGELYYRYPDLFTWEAAQVLGAAQRTQDKGSTWQVAFTAAAMTVENIDWSAHRRAKRTESSQA